MFRNYLTAALRNILRDKRLFLLNLSGLSIGIACAVLLLLYVYHEWTYDRYHQHANQLYRLACSTKIGTAVTEFAALPPAIGPALAKAIPDIEKMARFQYLGKQILVQEKERFTQEGIYFADSSLLKLFTYRYRWGNEDALREKNSIVLTQSLADRLFGSTTKNPLGRVIGVSGQNLTVRGVIENTPANSHFAFSALIAWHSFPFGEPWDDAHAYTYVKLANGASVDAFKAKITQFVARDPHLRELAERLDAQIRVLVQPLTDIHLHSHFLGELSEPGNNAYVYAFVVIALFFVGCAGINYTNLALAGSVNRSREIGVRKVLGAQSRHIGQQFLLESFLLTVGAALLGLGIVWLALPFFNQLIGKELRWSVLYFPSAWLSLLGLIFGIGLFSGAYPALYLARLQPTTVLKTRHLIEPGHWSLRKVLVIGQFTVAIVMITATWLIQAQMAYISRKELGFTKENILTVPIPGHLAKNLDYFKTQVRQLPEVVGAAASNYSPGNAPKDEHRFESPSGEMKVSTVYRLHIDYSYLSLMGMSIVKGRGFDPSFKTDFTNAFLVNEAAVRAFGWDTPGQNPLGKKIEGFNYGKQGVVIGVVKDAHLASLHQKIEPVVMNLSPRDYQWGEMVYIKIRGNHPKQTLAAVQQQYDHLFEGYPFEYAFLDEQYDRLYKSDQRMSATLASGAIVMVLISCLGIFGLSAFLATQKTKETAIRKVLGASVRQITSLHVSNFFWPVIVANAMAWPLAFWLMQTWLQDFAYRISIPFYVFPLSGLFALLIVVGTVSYHAIQNAKANPLKFLKQL